MRFWEYLSIFIKHFKDVNRLIETDRFLFITYLKMFPGFKFVRHAVCDSLISPRFGFSGLKTGWSHERAFYASGFINYARTR